MEAARAAVSKITGRSGHRTDVDEVVNPAVTAEVVKHHKHEETIEAVDREVHQHHFHTTVQPIAHKEVLPEKHTHNMLPQVEREFRHDNEDETHRRVSAELGQFQNTTSTAHTTHSSAAGATVAGEHVHHHVHETVQPVIHKETVQPEVVHTTVPIHEVHHASAQYHGISALPMKTLDEFSKAGGLIAGTKSHTHEEYDGAPRPYNEKLMTTLEKVLPGHHGEHTGSGTTGINGRTDSGIGGNNTHHSHTGNKLDPRIDSDRDGRSGIDGHSSSGFGGNNTHHSSAANKMDPRVDSDRDGRSGMRGNTNLGTVGANNTHHASAADKLNPRKDADGDGRPGFMD